MASAHYPYFSFYGPDYDFWLSNGFNAFYLSVFLMKKNQNYIHYRDLILTLLALLVTYWFWRADEWLMVSLLFCFIGLASAWLRLVNHLFWKYVTKAMQWLVQPVLGTVIFCLALVPIGLLFQLFSRKKPVENTAFKLVDQRFDTAFFKRQW